MKRIQKSREPLQRTQFCTKHALLWYSLFSVRVCAPRQLMGPGRHTEKLDLSWFAFFSLPLSLSLHRSKPHFHKINENPVSATLMAPRPAFLTRVRNNSVPYLPVWGALFWEEFRWWLLRRKWCTTRQSDRHAWAGGGEREGSRWRVCRSYAKLTTTRRVKDVYVRVRGTYHACQVNNLRVP